MLQCTSPDLCNVWSPVETVGLADEYRLHHRRLVTQLEISVGPRYFFSQAAEEPMC